MRYPKTLLILIGLTLSGCANNQLRYSTVRQASTLTDLQYQQVLDNLAMFCSDPDALPWHVNLKTGAVQVTDSGTGGFLGQTDFTRSFASSPNVSGTRSIVQQWGSVPVTDDKTLRLLRTAYQIALGSRLDRSPDQPLMNDVARALRDQTATNADISLDTDLFNAILKEFDPFGGKTTVNSGTKTIINDAGKITIRDDTTSTFIKEYHEIKDVIQKYCEINCSINSTVNNDVELQANSDSNQVVTTPLARDVIRKVNDIRDDFTRIPTCWFGHGRKKDIPSDACYVGKSGNVYTWVCPDNRAKLADFSLIILDLATVIKDSQVVTSPSGVQFSPGTSRP